jgi:hypothetical protein
VAPAPAPRITWVDLPTWLCDSDWRDVLSELEQPLELNSARPGKATLAQNLGNTVSQSPWVSKVHSVLTRHDGQIRIRAEFRKPCAMLARGGQAFLVDERGVRLPRDLPISQVDRTYWLPITGVKGPPPEAPGQAWAGEDLAAGMKLLRFLHEVQALSMTPFWPVLRAVDVTHYSPQRGDLRITTADPSVYIIWGRPPGDEYEIEASSAKKLDALRTLFLSQGGALGSHPLDLRDSDLILRLTSLTRQPDKP